MGEEINISSRRRALCVVPHIDTFELVRLQLLDRGCEAHCVETAKGALERARMCDYDIYILDNWWLDDGHGIELCRDIRRIDPATPILFYSSNANASEIARALEAGAQAYIPLPDVSVELPRVVEQLVCDAETRNGQALKEEMRAIREHVAEWMKDLDRKQEAAAKHFSEALQKGLRAHALAAFVRAGGKAARFDRLWPRALQEAADSVGER